MATIGEEIMPLPVVRQGGFRESDAPADQILTRTAATSLPRTVASGATPESTAVTSRPIWRSEAATSEPMKPMPTTTARAPGLAT